jgi:hypothetical protein
MVTLTVALIYSSGRDRRYCSHASSLLLLGVHGLLQRDAELLTYGLKLLEVLLVLGLVLDLEFDAWIAMLASERQT